MSSKKDEPNSDKLQDEFVRFLKEEDPEPLVAAGPIPEGHEGPYMPTKEEYIKGVRIVTQSRLEFAKARANIAEERIKSPRVK